MAQCIIHVKCIIVNSIHSIFHLNPAEATSADPGGKTSEKLQNCSNNQFTSDAERLPPSSAIHSPAPLRRTALEPAQSGDGART